MRGQSRSNGSDWQILGPIKGTQRTHGLLAVEGATRERGELPEDLVQGART